MASDLTHARSLHPKHMRSWVPKSAVPMAFNEPAIHSSVGTVGAQAAQGPYWAIDQWSLRVQSSVALIASRGFGGCTRFRDPAWEGTITHPSSMSSTPPRSLLISNSAREDLSPRKTFTFPSVINACFFPSWYDLKHSRKVGNRFAPSNFNFAPMRHASASTQTDDPEAESSCPVDYNGIVCITNCSRAFCGQCSATQHRVGGNQACSVCWMRITLQVPLPEYTLSEVVPLPQLSTLHLPHSCLNSCLMTSPSPPTMCWICHMLITMISLILV